MTSAPAIALRRSRTGTRGVVRRAASALVFAASALCLLAFPGSASEQRAGADGIGIHSDGVGIAPGGFSLAEWRSEPRRRIADNWTSADFGTFRADDRGNPDNPGLLAEWSDRLSAVPGETLRDFHSQIANPDRVRSALVSAAPTHPAVVPDLARWWENRAQTQWRELADFGAQTLSDRAERELAARFGFVERVGLEYRANLAGREGSFSADIIGALAARENGVVAWQLRAARGSDHYSGNFGLLHRLALGDRDTGGLFAMKTPLLAGINAFLDYQEHDFDNFWRASLGGELRFGFLDFYGNRYFAMSDAVVRGDEIARTLEGFDAEVNISAPGADWLAVGAGFYEFQGEDGRPDERGRRFHLRLLPPVPAGSPSGLELELEYDRPQDGDEAFGGRISYSQIIGDDFRPSRYRAFGGGFVPRAHFYDPARREHQQRIRVYKAPSRGLSVVVSRLQSADFVSDEGGEVKRLLANDGVVLPSGEIVFRLTPTGAESEALAAISAGGRGYVEFNGDAEAVVSEAGQNVNLVRGGVRVVSGTDGRLVEVLSAGNVRAVLVGTDITASRAGDEVSVALYEGAADVSGLPEGPLNLRCGAENVFRARSSDGAVRTECAGDIRVPAPSPSGMIVVRLGAAEVTLNPGDPPLEVPFSASPRIEVRDLPAGQTLSVQVRPDNRSSVPDAQLHLVRGDVVAVVRESGGKISQVDAVAGSPVVVNEDGVSATANCNPGQRPDQTAAGFNVRCVNILNDLVVVNLPATSDFPMGHSGILFETHASLTGSISEITGQSPLLILDDDAQSAENRVIRTARPLPPATRIAPQYSVNGVLFTITVNVSAAVTVSPVENFEPSFRAVAPDFRGDVLILVASESDSAVSLVYSVPTNPGGALVPVPRPRGATPGAAVDGYFRLGEHSLADGASREFVVRASLDVPDEHSAPDYSQDVALTLSVVSRPPVAAAQYTVGHSGELMFLSAPAGFSAPNAAVGESSPGLVVDDGPYPVVRAPDALAAGDYFATVAFTSPDFLGTLYIVASIAVGDNLQFLNPDDIVAGPPVVSTLAAVGFAGTVAAFRPESGVDFGPAGIVPATPNPRLPLSPDGEVVLENPYAGTRPEIAEWRVRGTRRSDGVSGFAKLRVSLGVVPVRADFNAVEVVDSDTNNIPDGTVFITLSVPAIPAADNFQIVGPVAGLRVDANGVVRAAGDLPEGAYMLTAAVPGAGRFLGTWLATVTVRAISGRLLNVADLVETGDLNVDLNIFPNYIGAAHTVTLKAGYAAFNPAFSVADADNFAIGETNGILSVLAANPGAANAAIVNVAVNIPFNAAPPVGDAGTPTAPLEFAVTINFNRVFAPTQDSAEFAYQNPNDPAPEDQIVTLSRPVPPRPVPLLEANDVFGPGTNHGTTLVLVSGGRVSVRPGAPVGNYAVSVRYRNADALGEITLSFPLAIVPAELPAACETAEPETVLRVAAGSDLLRVFAYDNNNPACFGDIPPEVNLQSPDPAPAGFVVAASGVSVSLSLDGGLAAAATLRGTVVLSGDAPNYDARASLYQIPLVVRALPASELQIVQGVVNSDGPLGQVATPPDTAGPYEYETLGASHAEVTVAANGQISAGTPLADGEIYIITAGVRSRNNAEYFGSWRVTVSVELVEGPPIPAPALASVVLPQNRAITRRAADGFTGTTFVTIAAEAGAPGDIQLNLPDPPPTGFAFNAASVLIVNNDNPVRTGEPTVATVTAVARRTGNRPTEISILVSLVPLVPGEYNEGGNLDPLLRAEESLQSAGRPNLQGIRARFGLSRLDASTGFVCEKAGEEDEDGNEIAPPGFVAVESNCGVAAVGTNADWRATIYLVSAYISHPNPAVLLGSAVQKMRIEILEQFDYHTIRPDSRSVQLVAELGYLDVIHRIVPAEPGEGAPGSGEPGVSFDLLNAPAVDTANPVPLIAYEEPYGNTGRAGTIAVFGHSVAGAELHQLTVTVHVEDITVEGGSTKVTTSQTLEVEIDYHPVSIARDGDGDLVPQEFAFEYGQRGVVGTLQAPAGIPDFVSNRRFGFLESAPGWVELSPGGELKFVGDPPANVVERVCPVGTPQCDDPMRQVRLDARLYSPNFVRPRRIDTVTLGMTLFATEEGSIPIAARITLSEPPPAIAPTVFAYDRNGGAGIFVGVGNTYEEYLRDNRNINLAPIKITRVGQALTLTRRNLGGQNELVRYRGIRRGLHILQVEENRVNIPRHERTPLLPVAEAARVCEEAGPDWRLPEYEEAAGLLNDGTSVDFPQTSRHPEYAPGETLALNPVASSDIPALSGLTLAVSLYAPGTHIPAANPLHIAPVADPFAVRLNVACVAEADPDNYNRPPLRAVASFSPPSAEAKILPPVPAFLSTLASAKLSAVRSAAAGQSADHSAAAEVSLVANPGNAFALSDDDGEVRLVLQTRTYDPGTVAVTVVAEARAGLGPVVRWEVAVSKLEYEADADPQFYFAGQPVASVGAVVPVQARSQLSDTRENIVAYMKYGGQRRGLHFMSLESALSENDRKLEAAYDCAVARLQAGETGPGNCVFAALGVGPDADLSRYLRFNSITDLPQNVQSWWTTGEANILADTVIYDPDIITPSDYQRIADSAEEELLEWFQGDKVIELGNAMNGLQIADGRVQMRSDLVDANANEAAAHVAAAAILASLHMAAGSPDPYNFPDDRVPTTALPDGFQHPLCEAMNSGDSSGLHQWRVPTLAELAGLANARDEQTETRIHSSGVTDFPGAHAGATLQLSGAAGSGDADGLDISHLYFADIHGRSAKRVMGTNYHRTAPVLLNVPLNDVVVEIMGLEDGFVPLDAKPVCVRAVSPGSYTVPARLSGVLADGDALRIFRELPTSTIGAEFGIPDRAGPGGTLALLTLQVVRYTRTGPANVYDPIASVTLISDAGYSLNEWVPFTAIEVGLVSPDPSPAVGFYEATLVAGTGSGTGGDLVYPITIEALGATIAALNASLATLAVRWDVNTNTNREPLLELLRRGADPNTVADGMPVLLRAAAAPHNVVVDLLAEYGADLRVTMAADGVHRGVTIAAGYGVHHILADFSLHSDGAGSRPFRIADAFPELLAASVDAYQNPRRTDSGAMVDWDATLPNGDTALDLIAVTLNADGDPRPISEQQREIAMFLHARGVQCARDAERELCDPAMAAVSLPFPRYLAKMRAFVTVDAEDYSGRGAVFSPPDPELSAMLSVRGFAAAPVRSVAQAPGARLAIQRRHPSTLGDEFIFTLTATMPNNDQRDVVFRAYDDPSLLQNICRLVADARVNPDFQIGVIGDYLRRGVGNLGYSCRSDNANPGTHRTPLHVAIEEARPTEAQQNAIGARAQMGPLTMSFNPQMVTVVQMLADAPGTNINASRYATLYSGELDGGPPLVVAARLLPFPHEDVPNTRYDGVVNEDLVDIVRILRDAGADPNQTGAGATNRRDRLGYTFLHFVSYYWYRGMGPVMEEFIRPRPRDDRHPIRADINTTNQNGAEVPNTTFLNFMSRDGGVHWQGANAAAQNAARDAERARIISALRASPNVQIPAE